MTIEQYHAIDDKIESSGAVPVGLMLHTCFRQGNGLAIFDVWESQEAFSAVGPMIMSIVQEVGAEMGAPQFVEMVAYEVP